VQGFRDCKDLTIDAAAQLLAAARMRFPSAAGALHLTQAWTSALLVTSTTHATPRQDQTRQSATNSSSTQCARNASAL
jgi:hypothetical protein